MRLRAVFLPLALLLLLSACAPSPDADVADKYVGHWTMCMVTDANSSDGTSITVKKKNANTLDVKTTVTQYPGVGCTGSPLSEYIARHNVALTGTTVIEGQTVDKIELTIVSDNDPNQAKARQFKDLWFIAERVLYLGAPQSGRDAQGYPVAVNLGWGLTKQ